MTHLFSNIYLGSLINALDDDFINDNKIKHIIRLSENYNDVISTENIKRYNFVVSDFPDQAEKLFNLLPKIYDIIYNIPVDENILIHCNIGKSRSASVVIYYIMRKYDIKDYDSVLKKIQAKRPIVNPNIGFRNIFKKYEKNIFLTYKLDESKSDTNDDDEMMNFLINKN